jgi:hypothetical protein
VPRSHRGVDLFELDACDLAVQSDLDAIEDRVIRQLPFERVATFVIEVGSIESAEGDVELLADIGSLDLTHGEQVASRTSQARCSRPATFATQCVRS